ncbi:MAG: biosynthetic-type acetolactate synthase large subunit [Spirochaetaceae bacterium]|jgi:acetolactate synthase-1/2/3 large subunit|nr:biosynthetic-type acetolactate synthase large subunit [Spirochaetaceae bacterium]
MITATGAQIITGILERQGVSTVAGIPGGSILPLYDELARSSIRHILVRHEQAAGFIAQGMTRSTGKTAVCMATSGPGVMNLLTAVADARCDSIPMVVITGQVNRHLIGTDAFQETDTFGLSLPITKHSVMVKSAEELLTALPRAFAIAASGRPGPVLIDVPRDVQLEKISFEEWPSVADRDAASAPAGDLLNKAAALIMKARRPAFFCGGGVIASGAAPALRKFAEKCDIPVAVSLLGIGVLPWDHPLYAGMVGMHGSFAANSLLHDADLIIAAGVRFDDRAVGLIREFCPAAEIIHIDIDAAEINKIYPSAVPIISDAARALEMLEPLCSARKHPCWLETLEVKRSAATAGYGDSPHHPSVLIPRIAALAEQVQTEVHSGNSLQDTRVFVTTDVGQHQMWTAQLWPVSFPRQFITSGSLGTMGFGLPAAIGAALANPGRRVICFSGDGSIMMNVQELATLAELELDVTVIVFDNACLGMVRQQQELLFGGTYSACIYSKTPNLVRIAEGFGIYSFDLDDYTRFDTVITKALSGSGPRFVRIPIAQELNVYPFVPAGKANIDASGVIFPGE